MILEIHTMFSFFRKKSPPEQAKSAPTPDNTANASTPAVVPAPAAPARQGWLDRLKNGLRKTGSNIATVFTGTRIDDELYEELETALLMADTGVKATEHLLQDLKRRVKEAKATEPAQVKGLLADAIAASGMEPEVVDPRKFDVPIDEGSVHQGAALEVRPLNWGKLADVAISGAGAPLVVLLDRVTDPHNVGAVLRSAEVFGARAVIAPRHHSAPETGALAKTASGALERQPYLRVTNLADAMLELKAAGYVLIGLDGDGEVELGAALEGAAKRPVALVLGAEGPGLRDKTRETCDVIARIPFAGAFGSLNVSNAAAVGLYAAASRLG